MSENLRTLRFVFIICFISASILSGLATLLKNEQAKAKAIDQQEQLLLAANIPILSKEEIASTYTKRIRPMLVDDKGELISFEKANVNY